MPGDQTGGFDLLNEIRLETINRQLEGEFSHELSLRLNEWVWNLEKNGQSIFMRFIFSSTYLTFDADGMRINVHRPFLDSVIINRSNDQTFKNLRGEIIINGNVSANIDEYYTWLEVNFVNNLSLVVSLEVDQNIGDELKEQIIEETMNELEGERSLMLSRKFKKKDLATQEVYIHNLSPKVHNDPHNSLAILYAKTDIGIGNPNFLIKSSLTNNRDSVLVINNQGLIRNAICPALATSFGIPETSFVDGQVDLFEFTGSITNPELRTFQSSCILTGSVDYDSGKLKSLFVIFDDVDNTFKIKGHYRVTEFDAEILGIDTGFFVDYVDVHFTISLKFYLENGQLKTSVSQNQDARMELEDWIKWGGAIISLLTTGRTWLALAQLLFETFVKYVFTESAIDLLESHILHRSELDDRLEITIDLREANSLFPGPLSVGMDQLDIGFDDMYIPFNTLASDYTTLILENVIILRENDLLDLDTGNKDFFDLIRAPVGIYPPTSHPMLFPTYNTQFGSRFNTLAQDYSNIQYDLQIKKNNDGELELLTMNYAKFGKMEAPFDWDQSIEPPINKISELATNVGLILKESQIPDNSSPDRKLILVKTSHRRYARISLSKRHTALKTELVLEFEVFQTPPADSTVTIGSSNFQFSSKTGLFGWEVPQEIEFKAVPLRMMNPFQVRWAYIDPSSPASISPDFLDLTKLGGDIRRIGKTVITFTIGGSEMDILASISGGDDDFTMVCFVTDENSVTTTGSLSRREVENFFYTLTEKWFTDKWSRMRHDLARGHEIRALLSVLSGSKQIPPRPLDDKLVRDSMRFLNTKLSRRGHDLLKTDTFERLIDPLIKNIRIAKN